MTKEWIQQQKKKQAIHIHAYINIYIFIINKQSISRLKLPFLSLINRERERETRCKCPRLFTTTTFLATLSICLLTKTNPKQFAFSLRIFLVTSPQFIFYFKSLTLHALNYTKRHAPITHIIHSQTATSHPFSNKPFAFFSPVDNSYMIFASIVFNLVLFNKWVLVFFLWILTNFDVWSQWGFWVLIQLPWWVQ